MAFIVLPSHEMDDAIEQELRALRREYLADVEEQLRLIEAHAERLVIKKQFKTAFPVLLYMSHQLKGSGGSLGFPEVSEIAQRMSDQLNGFIDDTEPRPAPSELSVSILALATELKAAVRRGRLESDQPAERAS